MTINVVEGVHDPYVSPVFADYLVLLVHLNGFRSERGNVVVNRN